MLGKVNYVDFLANLIISLTCLGIPLYGTREISKARHDPALRQRLFRDLLRIQLIMALIGIAVFTVLLYFHPRYANEHVLIGLGVLYILSNVLSADWYLQGMEAFKFISLRSILLRLVGIGAIFLLLHRPADYIWYYGIIAITQLATLLINYSYIRPAADTKLLPPRIAEHLPLLFFFFISSTFISIYDYIDTVMLGWLAKDENVGFYTTAMKLVKMALLLILSINTILFPRLSFLSEEKRNEELLALLNKSIGFILAAALPAMALFILLAPELIHVFAGPSFAPSIEVIRWLSPLPLVIALSNLFLLYYLSRFGKSKKVFILIGLAFVISISLNYFLIPVMSERGAAIASISTETFIMLFFAAWLQIKFSFKDTWQPFVASLLFYPVVFGLKKLELAPLPTLLFCAAACGIIYLVTMLLFKNNSLRSIRNYLSGQ